MMAMSTRQITPKKWFRAKRFGWGWTPNTWQGWTVVGVWMALFLTATIAPQVILSDSASAAMWGIGAGFALTGALLIIAYRTGEPPAWHWGDWLNKK